MRVPTQLRDLVDGAAVVQVDVAEPRDGGRPDVAAVLDTLAVAYPALERRVRDEQGRMRQHVNVFIGSDNVRDRDGTATRVEPGAELTILPAVSGG